MKKEEEHEIYRLIRLKKEADKSNAHPKITQRIEKQIADTSKRIMSRIRKSRYLSDFLDN